MSYFHKRYGRGRRALSGVQSQPTGGRIARGALGATISEYLLVPLPEPPPPPPPTRVMASRGRVGPRWYRQLQGGSLGGSDLGTLGADAPTGHTLAVPTISENDPATTTFRTQLLASNQALLDAERERTHKEQVRGFLQIAATLSIPLAAAIWRALGIGRRRNKTQP